MTGMLLTGAQTAGQQDADLPGGPQGVAQLAQGQGQSRHNSEGDEICLQWTRLSFFALFRISCPPGSTI